MRVVDTLPCCWAWCLVPGAWPAAHGRYYAVVQRIIRLKKRQGLIRARIAGIESATGEVGT